MCEETIRNKIVQYHNMFPKGLEETKLQILSKHVNLDNLCYFVSNNNKVVILQLAENEPCVEIVAGVNELGLQGLLLFWSLVLLFSKLKHKGVYTSALSGDIIAKNSRLKWLLPVHKLTYNAYWFDDIDFGQPPLGECNVCGFNVQFNNFFVSITDTCSCVPKSIVKRIAKYLQWPLVYTYSSYIISRYNIEYVYKVDASYIKQFLKKTRNKISDPFQNIKCYNIPFTTKRELLRWIIM